MPSLFLDCEYNKQVGKHDYCISTAFHGVFEEGEEIAPFALVYYRDENGKHAEDFTEYFATMDDLEKRKKELI